MSRSTLNHAAVITALGSTLALSPQAFAEFLADSKASVELRNFYFNRDFRQDNAAQSKQDEWAQGFLLRYESGYTEGTIGVGVDAIGLLGLKLDSSPDRAGSGLLPRDKDKVNGAPDDYSELGLTAKLRASKSTLKIGTLLPKLPTVLANDSRLLPQTSKCAPEFRRVRRPDLRRRPPAPGEPARLVQPRGHDSHQWQRARHRRHRHQRPVRLRRPQLQVDAATHHRLQLRQARRALRPAHRHWCTYCPSPPASH